MVLQTVPLEQRTDARANRERIVRAATDAFAARGLGVEMKEIAEAAGVAVGTIYRHFPSKEDLLTAIARAMLDEAGVAIATCNDLPDPIEGLGALIAGNLTGVARFGWLAGVLHGGQIPRHHLDELKAEMEAKGFHRRFQPLLERAIAAGRLRDDLDVTVASAMLEGATAPWTCAAVLSGREPEQAAAAIMRVFLEGAAGPQGETVSTALVGPRRMSASASTD
ncbi:MAG TPA: TetR/AcrR family transcriptional regulator [Dehalococcoidia bacterium]|nr:TetR/AcrR family transcriptional regulator [Dehalococcoidia bacterium]